METMYNSGMCRCCASEGTFKDLTSKYLWMGVDEIYADMLRECFDVTLATPPDAPDGGICEVCITQLRNAANFKKQVLSTEEQFKKLIQNKSFKSNIVKVEVSPPEDDAQFTDEDNNLSNDDFSSTEYDMPIKTESSEDGKSRKRSAKAGPSRSKQPKLSESTSKPMLFKVVKTIQSGKYAMAVVPESWERDGTLHWPVKHKFGILNIGDILNPGDEWEELDCIVKRKNIESYKDAVTGITAKETDLNNVNVRSDVDFQTVAQIRKPPDLKTNDKNNIGEIETNLNRSASNCVSTESPLETLHAKNKDLINPTTLASSTHKTNPEGACVLLNTVNTISEKPLRKIESKCSNNTDVCGVKSVETITIIKKHVTNKPSSSKSNDTSHNTETQNSQNVDNEKINQKLDDLTAKVSTILQNQTIMSLNQATLNNMFEEFMKMKVTSTNPNFNEKNIFDFQIIENEKDLQVFEERLKNPIYMQNLQNKFSLLSGRDDGNGVNVAYKLIDIMFSRNFMTQCSWAGGSRQDNVRKVCFKMFQRTIDFFFLVVRDSDHLFTLEDCEKFFKMILRNSKSRNQSLNIRKSTRKHRKRRRLNEEFGVNDEADDEERQTVEMLIDSAITIDEDQSPNYD